jgi:hypothetical protein
MVDAAIERLAHERDAQEGEAGKQRTREHAASYDEHALVVPNDSNARERRLSTRLRWKGLDVSDEFRNYAERVARGEDLPPFEGPVLAEPNPAFPFGPAPVERESAPERTAGSGRTSRIALWTSAAVVLGLIGWSLAQKVDADESRAGLNAVPSASPSTDIATSTATSPHDVVETPAPQAKPPEVQAAVVDPDPVMTEGAPLTAAPSDPNQAVDAPLQAAVAGASTAEGAAISSAPVDAVVPAAAPSAAAAAPATIAAPGASLEHAVSAAPQPAGPGAPHAATAAARAKGVAEEDFGILPAGDGAPVSTPASTALLAAKSVASVNGNVGDLARSGQVPTGAARKEPGSESSAKGSLLVETPSF